jgi:DNA-directed RNA polymerase specialized sigma24 family protein
LSLDEIAAALEIPLGTVKSRLHLAIKQLREDPRIKDLFSS